MNANSAIMTALKCFERPIFPDKYDRKKDNRKVAFIQNVDKGYFVFNYVSEIGVLYGDNTELEDKTALYVHYYTYGSLLDMIKPLKKALTESSFVINGIRRAHETDTGYNHLTVEVSIFSCDLEV